MGTGAVLGAGASLVALAAIGIGAALLMPIGATLTLGAGSIAAIVCGIGAATTLGGIAGGRSGMEQSHRGGSPLQSARSIPRQRAEEKEWEPNLSPSVASNPNHWQDVVASRSTGQGRTGYLP
jgi:hypothetical protein